MEWNGFILSGVCKQAGRARSGNKVGIECGGGYDSIGFGYSEIAIEWYYGGEHGGNSDGGFRSGGAVVSIGVWKWVGLGVKCESCCCFNNYILSFRLVGWLVGCLLELRGELNTINELYSSTCHSCIWSMKWRISNKLSIMNGLLVGKRCKNTDLNCLYGCFALFCKPYQRIW